MARRVALPIVALFVGSQAVADQEIPGDPNDYFKPSSVPSDDACGVNCYRICGDILGRAEKSNDGTACRKACWAHSIQTTRDDEWQTEQGKYVQKVMIEYCGRGVCAGGTSPRPTTTASRPSTTKAPTTTKASTTKAPTTTKKPATTRRPQPWWVPRLLQQLEAEHQKQEEQAGGQWGFPAQPKGWPKTCAENAYYCKGMCENMWHAVSTATNLGEHPGTENWEANQKRCKADCIYNFNNLTKYFNEFCTCFRKNEWGVPLPPGLVQEEEAELVDIKAHEQVESVDVGSFIQTSAEL